MSKGATVLEEEKPWARYQLADGICAYCSKSLPQRPVPCSNDACHEEYCGRECRRIAETLYHGFVCQKPLFQELELDLYHQFKRSKDFSERNSVANYLLTTRICAICAREGMLPSATAQLRSLSGKITFAPNMLSSSVLSIYERTADVLGCRSTFAFEDYVSILARIAANVFTTETEIALYIARSMFNHSCDENVVEDGATRQLVCKRPVAAGEELTINYYPRLRGLKFEERHHQLNLRGLVCQCAKCTMKQ
jgi:hypothetical protein